jgi:nitrate/TMAO reductase-like tetraheme cytochrome c subunit
MAERAMPKRMAYVCGACGSSQVALDAWAAWDVELQNWVLRNTSTTEFCDDCNSETTLIEVVLSPSPAWP